MTREDKLKKLKDHKVANGMVVMTDGGPFIEALQSKITDLKKVLGTELNVNVDDLIEELAKVQTIAPLVEELQKAIQAIDIPEMPESIKLTGLSAIEDVIKQHIATINKIPDLKLPEANIKVDVQQLGQKDVEEITERLDKLIGSIKQNMPGETQQPGDFLPVRRVRSIGNRLVFDDNIWAGGGGGGGSSVQDTLITDNALKVVNPDGTNIGGSGGTSSTDDAAFTAGTGSGTPIMGFATSDSVDAGDVGVLGMDTARNLKVSIEVDNVGIGGGTQYAVDTALGATPTGTLAIAIRDDALSALTPVEGDAIGLRVGSTGALWTQVTGTVTVDGSGVTQPVSNAGLSELAAAINSSQLDVNIATDSVGIGGGTQYTEDAAAAANPVGTALNLIRDDALAGSLTSADGDNVSARGNNKGEQYVKATDTDALLTTIDSDTSTLAGAVSGSEMQVDIVTSALPTGAATSANQTTIIGHVDGIETLLGTIDTDTGDIAAGFATEGSALGSGVLLQGDDGTDRKNINVDATTGDVQVDVTNTVTVDGSGVTQPVSGTVIANLSATDNAVLDDIAANQTDASQKTQIVDGAGNVIGATSNALDVNIASGSSSGTEYTEDAVAPADPVGGTLMMTRDDALSTVTEAEGDWSRARGTAEGALWVQDFNSDAILADTANMDTNLGTIAGAVSGSEMQVDIVASLPAGTNNIGDIDVLTFPSTVHSADYDTGAGTDTTLAFGIAVPASGGAAVVPGDATAGLKVNLGADNDVTLATLPDTASSDLATINSNTDYGAVTGGGTETGALRVTVANNSTGVLSVDDNGGSLTVDGTVTVTDGLNIEGDIAAAATDSGNPVKIGGKYNSTMPTYTNGQRGNAEITTRGSLKTTLFVDNSATAVAAAATNADGVTASSIASHLETASLSYMFNGTTWDRIRGDTTNGLTVNLGSNNDVTLATLPDTASSDLATINSNTDTLAVTGGGTETGALRVTVANNSTGVLSVDDNGGALTVDNGGTFATQVDGDALTALQLIDDPVFADDAAVTLGTSKGGIVAGVAVQTDGTDPTVVSAEGDAAALRTDMQRNLIVNQTHPRHWSASVDYATAQTNATVKAAPGVGLKLYITDIMVSNGATAGNITLLDGSGGTVVYEIYPAINGGAVNNLRTPIVLTANTLLAITSTTVTTHSVTVSGYISP